MSKYINRYNSDCFQEIVLNTLSKNDPDFNKAAVRFEKNEDMLIANYMPMAEPTAADLTVYMKLNSGEVSMHGNLQSAIPTIKTYYDLQDFEYGIELTELRRAFGDTLTKGEYAMKDYIQDKSSFQLSYSNPDIDWQIKEAVKLGNMPSEQLASIDKNKLQTAFSVLAGYKAALSYGKIYNEKQAYNISKSALQSGDYDYESRKETIDLFKEQAEDFRILDDEIGKMKDKLSALLHNTEKCKSKNTKNKISQKEER